MNSTKRVVHITTVHHPYDPRIYHKECMSLQQARYDVTLIAKEANEGVRENTEITHIPLKQYSNRFKRIVFATIEAYKTSKKLKADIYHFHDPELLLVGWLLKKKDNIVIYDIHEDYVTSILQKDYINKAMRKLIAKIYKLMEKFLIKNMELCLAEKYYYDIYKRGIQILNYPTINKKFMNAHPDHRKVEDKLVYTGNVTVERGALIHAKIPRIHDSVSVHFVGKCARELSEEMYRIAGNQATKISIEGIDHFVEKEDIEYHYLSHHWLAGIALFPPTEHYMKKELTKFFEYMNVGLPIICSNFPLWKEFIETYQCGIAVDPYNETEINEAIEYLRNNQEEAKVMGQNGRKAVIEELNWNSEATKLIKWYDKLLDESRENYTEKDRA